MITALELENFQSYRGKHQLAFSGGVNVIRGETDHGKTALMRAIRWVACNRPSGDGFITHGESACRVRLYLSGDCWVERSRSKKENIYRLQEKGKEERVFAAMGQDVPEPVAQLLNLDLEAGVQQQMDSPFLLSEGSGDMTRRINAVANIGEIDFALSNLNGDIRKTRQDMDSYVRQLGGIEAELVSFMELDGQLNILTRLKRQDRMRAEMRILCNKIVDWLSAFGQKFSDWSRQPDLRKAEKRVQELLEDAREAGAKRKQALQLDSLLDGQHGVRKALSELPDRKTTISRQEQVETLFLQIKETGTFYNERMKIEKLLDRLSSIRGSIKETEERLTALERKWKTEMPKECPLCGK